MFDSNPPDVDLVKELRLRRWARRNYVPPESRQNSWHPIILDEMRNKDTELVEQTYNRPVGLSYVPLPAGHVLNAGHTPQRGPNLFREAEEAKRDTHG